MEAEIVDLHNMESLDRLIKSAFPVEKIKVSLNNTHFAVYFDESVTDKPAQIKAIHDYVKSYIAEHGKSEEEYQFSFYMNHELIDILHYNCDDAAYYISMELFGKNQVLRVQDVLGATGDYTIFNEDFEKIGHISASLNPEMTEDGTAQNPDTENYYSDTVYADFRNPEIWQVYPEALKPYLNEILDKVLEINNHTVERIEVNVEDPEDLSFWAEQFEISEIDLRKAVLAAGKSIDDITTYLQK